LNLPRIGLVVCNSGGSSTGHLTGLAAIRVINEFGNRIGICSLPALANNVPRQVALTKSIKHLIVVDGCHNRCASKILSQLGISYDSYINLEELGIKKLGPFTTLDYTEEELEKVYQTLASKVRELLSEEYK
jgi:uncharacterized metal-binding protein